MKALLVLAIMVLAAATAFAYGHSDVTNGISAVVEQSGGIVLSEPAMLLLSGALLLGLGGAVRRYTV